MNLQIRSPLDDVLVSDDVTSRINNEAGAETLQGLANFAWTNTIVAKELRVNILKRIAHGSLDHALGVDIDDCRQDLCHGQHGRFRSGIGLRKTGCPPCKGQQCSDQRAMRVSGEHTRPRVQRSAPSPSAPSAKQTAQGVFGVRKRQQDGPHISCRRTHQVHERRSERNIDCADLPVLGVETRFLLEDKAILLVAPDDADCGRPVVLGQEGAAEEDVCLLIDALGECSL